MTTTTTGVDDVLIVGGGDIGLVTALCIEKLNDDIDIQIVDNFSEDPPEVGKSTYQDIVDIIHDFLDVEEQRFLAEVKPIWKATVFFRDWTDHEPFHYTFDDLRKYPRADDEHALEKSYLYYHDLYDDPDFRTINELMVDLGKTPVSYDLTGGGLEKYGPRAYHLDLKRFNAFLRDLCEERGITLVDAEITAVETDGEDVVHVASAEDTFSADLYVDASGFARVITSEFDDAFRDFDLPLDSAFNAKVERDLDEAEPATVIESGDYGWFWQIDTFEFRDRGYVFASEFVDDEAAKAEFIEHCNGEISEEELTRYGFTSGYYEETWTGNRVAIGNAAGFVEPLQSTGLTANAKAATKLSNLLAAQGRGDYRGARDAYNGYANRLWESIYDFITIHYRYADGDTEFWEAVQSIPLSDRVTRIREHFDACGYDTTIDPVRSPHVGTEAVRDLAVFPTVSYFTMMRNMGVDSAFYEDLSLDVDDEIRAEFEDDYDDQRIRTEGFLTLPEFYQGVLSQVEL